MKRPTLEDRVEYLATLAFVRVMRALPPRLVTHFARLLGVLSFDVARYRRQVAIANLRRHLGGTAAPDGGTGSPSFQTIGRRCLIGFVSSLADLARLPLVDAKYIQANIETEGLEHLDQALERGCGAVLVTGHFGSWELMGCAVAKLGYPISFVVGVQRNPLVQRLMNQIRRECGIGVIEPDSLLGALRSLRSNRFIAMLSDQDVGKKNMQGVFVEFLGEQACTPRGAAQFALLARAPIIPGFIIRIGPTRHRIVIEKPIFPPEGREEEAVRALTQAYTRVIEAYVRRYPDHWLWTHKRWKTRPA